MAAKSDDEIDQLFQLPPGEFTGARNALAKSRRGADAAAVRELEKPSIAAWTVNQLYWRHRRAYDRLLDAAANVRAANAAMMAGRKASLRESEAAQNAAVKAALDVVRGVLKDAGDAATPATIAAVTETLRALPGPGAPGRLSRPLKPLGFEALSGLVTPAVERQAAASQKREDTRAREDLDEAREAEKDAAAALAKAKRAHEAAERVHSELQAKVRDAAEKLRGLSKDVTDRTADYDAAAARRAKREAR